MTIHLRSPRAWLRGPAGRYESVECTTDYLGNDVVVPVVDGTCATVGQSTRGAIDEGYVTPDLDAYPPFDLLGLEFACDGEPLVVVELPPIDEPTILDVREGKDIGTLIKSICHKAVPEHEGIVVRSSIALIDDDADDDDFSSALHVEIIEHFLQDLGWVVLPNDADRVQ